MCKSCGCGKASRKHRKPVVKKAAKKAAPKKGAAKKRRGY